MECQKYVVFSKKMAIVGIAVTSVMLLSAFAPLFVIMAEELGFIGVELAKNITIYFISITLVCSIIVYFIGLVMNTITITK